MKTKRDSVLTQNKVFVWIVHSKYKILTTVIFLAAVLLIWVHLAVGIVDDWPLAGS